MDHDEDTSSSTRPTFRESASHCCEDERCRQINSAVSHCIDCDSSYCNECWSLQGAHKSNKRGRDGFPHEKTDPALVNKFRAILRTAEDVESLKSEHELNAHTKWFGVGRDHNGQPCLEDHGRSAWLMLEGHNKSHRSRCYPQLVSFVGVTNAGKSTLIRLLVKSKEMDMALIQGESRLAYDSPIMGSPVNDSVPTSGDVHLFADPATYDSDRPILYADCEGFEGGERVPDGSRYTGRDTSGNEQERDTVVRPLRWATSDDLRRREYAVSALFPRLLYTFSDCVVFVLRNAKTFESAVLSKLLDWGDSALETSINQPALPHCIVVLNGAEAVNRCEAPGAASTLDACRASFEENGAQMPPRFRRLAAAWRRRGRTIRTMMDLIHCYYSSLRTVRVTTQPSYSTLNAQIQDLYGAVQECCSSSVASKRQARTCINAEEFELYVQYGFDHFADHLDRPFDFAQVSLRLRPVSIDFGQHILNLCTSLKWDKATGADRLPARYDEFVTLLGSSIFLDHVRNRKGNVSNCFSEYHRYVETTMRDTFLDKYAQCAHISADDRQCMQTKMSHRAKGHQDWRGIISVGDFVSPFPANFVENLLNDLYAITSSIGRMFSGRLSGPQSALSDEKMAWEIHTSYLEEFHAAQEPIFSNFTCFCCLTNDAEHPLPCGHVLCERCVRVCGREDGHDVLMLYCPLHSASTQWEEPHVISFKPPAAGVRVLVLDGGGMRGIVQLMVLHELETLMGGELRIQTFFDLIVGAGSAALIATSLRTDRTAHECLDMFTAVWKLTAPRISLPQQIARTLPSKSILKTPQLYEALREVFGEKTSLFGSRNRRSNCTRTAVTTLLRSTRQHVLITDYRRPETHGLPYRLERPHDPEKEVETWRAVGAAMARPPYFKPFKMHGNVYVDAIRQGQNPVIAAKAEAEKLWDDAPLDILLSLGCGKNEEKLRRGIASGSMKKQEDYAEIAWQRLRPAKTLLNESQGHKRCFRINPDLKSALPHAYDLSGLDTLPGSLSAILREGEMAAALQILVTRLVASAFYFDVEPGRSSPDFRRTGIIACRFPTPSSSISQLGNFLYNRWSSSFQPFFSIVPKYGDSGRYEKRTLTKEILEKMRTSGVFGPIVVTLQCLSRGDEASINLVIDSGGSAGYSGDPMSGSPISGFPRVLIRNQYSMPPEYGSNNACKFESSSTREVGSSAFQEIGHQQKSSRDGLEPGNHSLTSSGGAFDLTSTHPALRPSCHLPAGQDGDSKDDRTYTLQKESRAHPGGQQKHADRSGGKKYSESIMFHASALLDEP